MRGRSSNTSTFPSTSSSSWTVPELGNRFAASIESSVVLPAPLGPSSTQRSSSPMLRFTESSRTEIPRLTVTSLSAATTVMGPTLPVSEASRVSEASFPRSLQAASYAPVECRPPST